MDITPLYKKYHKYSVGCDLKNQFKINKIMTGSGGSENIIVEVVDKTGNSLILKIIPQFEINNVRIKPDFSLLEIKFYEFFTKKYILTNRTPHIVAIYNHQQCTNIAKTLKGIRQENSKCQPLTKKLLIKTDPWDIDQRICDLILKNKLELVNPVFDMLLLENCPISLTEMIQDYIFDISRSNGALQKKFINSFINNLQRCLFQIIFTLAIIKDDYPGFYHGDFFMRNILCVIEKSYNENDFVAYHYRKLIFYLPANGTYFKINDFGLSVIVKELTPAVYHLEDKIRKYYNIDAYNKKNDIFNILQDIYDGRQFSSSSIMGLAAQNNISMRIINPVREFLKKFINVDVIDKINSTNPGILNTLWHIAGVKILEDTVETPQQYLTRKYFHEYLILPANGNVIKHFNL